MKILILGFAKIKYMPYLSFYFENIDISKNDVHLLYWNRDLQNEDTSFLRGITFHEFRHHQEDDVSKVSKIGSFKRYRGFALKTIRENQFDFIIVLHSLPGILISDKLKKHFLNQYIFDYRDSTYEFFLPYKKKIASLVKDSYVTFVSSDAFRKFLPQSESGKIYTTHNFLPDSLNHQKDKELFGIPSEKIRIAFWGFIRHEGINREIIRKVSFDPRFELHYYGREQAVAQNLKAYVSEMHARNVFFHGEYKPEDRYQFILQTDMIHNIYYDQNTMLAMGNKYYDGVIFRIPQICMKGSYMGKMVTKNNIGLECDPYDAAFLNTIYDYYTKQDKHKFYMDCKTSMYDFLEDYRIASKIVNLL